ncbi:MAG: SGNH/GDSL hydrolase family protein [Nitrospirae bacterium]|nr:SGNH/GDSL hydrolase family protein [Nitrospirota bacterium]
MKKNILLLLISVAAGVLIVEGGTRAIGIGSNNISMFNRPWAAPHPTLGWINRGGVYNSTEAGHVPMTFWNDGRRANRVQPVKTAKTRVLLIGCSFTQGYGVRDNETFSYLLDNKYPGIAFDNYGTGGYGTVQSFLMTRHMFNASPTAPDLVIYGYIPAHEDRNVASASWAAALKDAAGKSLSSPHAELTGGRVEFHPLSIIEPWPFERHSVLMAILHKGWLKVKLRKRPEQAHLVTQHVLTQMRDFVVPKSRFVVAVLVDDARLSLFMKDQGIEYINCAHPYYGKSSGGKGSGLSVGGFGHPNHILHAYWAGCISEWIDANVR